MTMAGTEGALPRTQDWVHAALLLSDWRRRFIAFGAGTLAAAAMPPIDAFPVYALAFPALVLMLDGVAASGRAHARALGECALIGWFFGFGYFVAGLWWLGSAFIAGGDEFIWLMPLGVIGLPMALALFTALGLAIAGLFWSTAAMRVFVLALGLGLSEWLRGFVLTGFPWNGFGQAFANHLIFAQIVSVIGTEALGVIAIALFATPVLLLTGGNAAGKFALPAFALLTLAAIAAYGAIRLHPVGGTRIDFSKLALVPGVKLRIMQPNIAQDAKNQALDGDATLAAYFALSDRAKGAHASGIGDVTHLIWPESPFPFVLERNARAIEAIRRFLPERTQLVTGAVRVEPSEDPARRFRYFNVMQVLNQSGIVASYDKVHLVPFGEYLPVEGLLRRLGLREFVREIGGFTPGAARQRLDVPGLPPVLALICFEAIFPAEIAADEAAASGLFINVTNDAWFGYTFGPYQHLAQARLRAIEFGKPLVRAANSGVSAVFDPYGRALATLPLGTADVLDAPLPAGLGGTFYASARQVSFASVMIFLAVCGLSGRKWRE